MPTPTASMAVASRGTGSPERGKRPVPVGDQVFLGRRPPPTLALHLSAVYSVPGLCQMLDDKYVAYYDHFTNEVQNRQVPSLPKSPGQQVTELQFACKALLLKTAVLLPRFEFPRQIWRKGPPRQGKRRVWQG